MVLLDRERVSRAKEKLFSRERPRAAQIFRAVSSLTVRPRQAASMVAADIPAASAAALWVILRSFSSAERSILGVAFAVPLRTPCAARDL